MPTIVYSSGAVEHNGVRLTETEVKLVRAMAAHTNWMASYQFSEALGISQSHGSRITLHLIGMGLVERQSETGRPVFTRLTAAGRKLAERVKRGRNVAA